MPLVLSDLRICRIRWLATRPHGCVSSCCSFPTELAIHHAAEVLKIPRRLLTTVVNGVATPPGLDRDTRRVIESSTFIRNVDVLSRFLAAPAR